MSIEAEVLKCFKPRAWCRRITGSGVVSASPVNLYAIHICPEDGSALYAAEVYDGQDSNGTPRIDFETQYGQSGYNFLWPMIFHKGLYIACTTNIKSVTVQYDREWR